MFNRVSVSRAGSEPRVALVHYWLIGMRGGEQVLEAMCRMFPQADIFTHVYDPDKVSPLINSHRVYTTSVSKMPFSRRMYQSYLPFMPRALEEVDLTGYDLILSSESGPAKGIIAPPDAHHLCYCHSPMRYLWDQYHHYRNTAGTLTRFAMPYLAHGLRSWDVTSAARVDNIAANSSHVAARVHKYWRRESSIVHPPVQVENFAPVPPSDRENFYLWAGELAPYKRPDLAIEAFNQMRKPLIMVGGPDKTAKRLQALAGPYVKILGRVPDGQMRELMAKCKALIFPGEEDFGMVPVEVMASGRPVIAYGRGGAEDTVVSNRTGLLFKEQSVEGLIHAIKTFEADKLDQIDPNVLVAHSRRFNEAAFRSGLMNMLPAKFQDSAFSPRISVPAE